MYRAAVCVVDLSELILFNILALIADLFHILECEVRQQTDIVDWGEPDNPPHNQERINKVCYERTGIVKIRPESGHS
jgi:hypothetical protein